MDRQTDHSIFEQVESAGAKVLVVTKYFDEEKTRLILEEVKNEPSFWALGENRVEALAVKNLPRDKCHFIGQIQARKISEISKYCAVVHSLSLIKHARMFVAMGELCPDFFLQVKLDPDKTSGVYVGCFGSFFQELLEIIPRKKILGISGMGRGEFTLEEKMDEFKILKDIRDRYLPSRKISAGTSRDYELALEAGIEVVRIGQKIFL